MTKTILTALALAALGGTALAADLPSRKGPVYAPLAPIFTWTGFYAGVNAGGVFTENTISTVGTAPFTIGNVLAERRPSSISNDETGFIGGAQIGYNYQIGSVVLGIETDIQYTDISSRTSRLGTSNATSVFSQDLDYLGTVRLRAGYAFDRVMVYATGGLAYGDVSNRATFFNAALPGQVDYVGGKSDIKVGFTVGGGVEYAFTNNLSLKAEYLYYDLGKQNVAVNQVNFALAPGSYVSRMENNGHIVRAGLNYRFSTF
ncbi:hypothetical protein IP69_00490 [Bosea sp. AAP35]|uniref:outer membrane protein n=1 Tax=Bosea sp. AAP35 TaxID=1523417 RepID=UPI0006B8D1C1|nr:outer membrane protein [Bosea sp. AAP35]KPF73088.1 hypothetical protein IP69_00490 [Bosea sp. AAP35]